jgi:poly(beta-D-mannuronate) lyase
MAVVGAVAGSAQTPTETAAVSGEGKVTHVSRGVELEEAVAAARPGETVVLSNGVWRDQRLALYGKGTRNQPIRIRAETPGEVHFTGQSAILLSGNDLILEGLHFRDGYLAGGGAVISLEGNRLRLADSVIDGYNPPTRGVAYDWVVMRGQNHEVEHCTFRGMNHEGTTLDVIGGGMNPDHHYVRNNSFVDRSSATGGGAAIRIDRSGGGFSASHNVVEGNLFEGYDSGVDLISNRSGGNTFRGNTFRRNRGALSLSQGQGNLVESNFFFGDNVAEHGVLRIHGRGQVVVNNYIERAGAWNQAAVTVGTGVPGTPIGSFAVAEGLVLAFNTIIDSPGPDIDLSGGLGERGRTLVPSNSLIGNNLFFARSNATGVSFVGQKGTQRFEGNISFGRHPGFDLADEQVRLVDPRLRRAEDGLMRPAPNSRAVAAAVGEYRMVARDIDGQRRSTMKDVGSDEISTAPIQNRPLTAKDVGAPWFRPAAQDEAGPGS